MSLLFKVKRKLYKAFHPAVGKIWMLHRCVTERSTDDKQRVLEITPDFLESKILEYKSQGYHFISIDEAANHIQNASPLFCRSKFLVVTFDDGYQDNLTMALPILKKHNIPFVVYITTDFIDNHNEMWWYPNQHLALSMDELLQLDAEPLCTIGAHTLSHPKLNELSPDDQQKEIQDSKSKLEYWLRHPVRHFSYPYGAHSDLTKQIAVQAGFSTIACAWGGPIRTDASIIDLSRIALKQE